jgi:hypothetical protein
MKPKEKKEVKKEDVNSKTVQSDLDIKKKLFPGLAMANDPKVRVNVNAISQKVKFIIHVRDKLHIFPLQHYM